MECDAFYDEHPAHGGAGDRCSRNEIVAGTAAQYSILSMGTTLCGGFPARRGFRADATGTLNLFVAGWTVKRFGARAALMAQTLVPALRVAAQILGVVAGKRAGMMLI